MPLWGDRKYTLVHPSPEVMATLFEGWFKFEKVNDTPCEQRFVASGASEEAPVYVVVACLGNNTGDAGFTHGIEFLEQFTPLAGTVPELREI